VRLGRFYRPKGIAADASGRIYVSDSTTQAVEKIGTRLGRENRLICLSCHKLHDGHSGRFMLAETLENSAFCLRCHQDHQVLVGSPHDLRQSAPQWRNRLGMTPEQSGPCGSCHMFHNLAIRPQPTDQDPSGLCATCHANKGVAGRTPQARYNHPVNVAVTSIADDAELPLYSSDGGPVMACLTCHNPHDNSRAAFLRNSPDNLCRACHGDIVKSLTAGAHDVRTAPKQWPAAADRRSRCLSCHAIHGSDPRRKLWKVAAAEDQAPADAVCMGCHDDVHWGQDDRWSLKAVLHTRSIDASLKPRLLVSAAGQAPSKRMGCPTCHDVHAGPGSHRLLRSGDTTEPMSLCFECHADTGVIRQSLHSRRALGAETDGTPCGPCHAIHAVERSQREMLWANRLAPQGRTASEKRCLGCHSPGGTASPPPQIVRHPQAPLEAVAWPGNEEKAERLAVTDEGKITCITCHLPHGRVGWTDEDTSEVYLASTKPMQRSGVASRFCSRCHGLEAIDRFLYYHHPEKRGRITAQEPNFKEVYSAHDGNWQAK